MKKYITIENAKDCCGCAACANICAVNAITMKEDEAGFIFPAVDEQKCVECGRCTAVCTFTQKGEGAGGEPEVFAAVNKDKAVLKESSSGGLFTPLAEVVLDRGGAVFGAAWDENLTLRHICVESKEDLKKLRGSKYVQSSTGDTFAQAKKMLNSGKWVCYSGTPCQIAGLKAFLGKDYDKLLTVDLVCHGVPSMKMLKDDLDFVSGGKTDSIKDVKFRDKSYGWGVKGSIISGNSKIKYNAGTSPYYFYFLKGEVYRESCYNCRFPSERRQGDITLGDYWGIKQELISQLGEVDADLGISCILVNSKKGKQWFEDAGDSLTYALSDRRDAERRNKQLTSASTPLPEHDTLLGGYVKNGYQAFRNGYKKHTKDHLIRTAKNMVPSKIKRKINDILS